MFLAFSRLKTTVPLTNVNEILRSTLTGVFLTRDGGTVGLDHGNGDGTRRRGWNTKNVFRHESWGRKLLNGGIPYPASSSKDVYANHCDHGRGTAQHLVRRVFLAKESPILLSTSPVNCHSWKSPKNLSPSTAQSFSFARKFSNSTGTCFPANPPNLFSRGEDSRRTGRDYVRRRFSSKSPCDDKGKSDQCKNQTKEQEAPKDCADDSSKPSQVQFYPDCRESWSCESPVDDPCPPKPPPDCFTPKFYTPCPNHEDYSSKEELMRMKLWRSVLLFIMFPLLLMMSCYVYMREMEKMREPRPEFIDFPYLRRRVKPFPWRDGKRTLFHNPVKNPVSPEGYLVPDPNEVKKKESTE